MDPTDPKQILQLASLDIIDADDVAYLLLLREQNPRIQFSLDSISDEDCVEFFRFDRATLEILVEEFHIPPEIITPTGTKFLAMEGLCILLRRLAYPNRYTDIKGTLHRSKTQLSIIFNWMLDFIYDNFYHLLTSLDLCWLTAEDFERFADAVHEKGSPLLNCWGFIDGTVRPICKPIIGQKVMWNGHYRVHSLVFQSVVAPNGLIANLDGPWPGRRHDAGILAYSGLIQRLADKMEEIGVGAEPYVLYGDPAYPVSAYLEAPFRIHAGELTEYERTFNKDMGMSRVAVEWVFGKIISLWAFVDFSENCKILLQPIGKYYIVAALLTNCHTAVFGGQTQSHFGLMPPTLLQYLRHDLNV